jgi:hypothetical protein
VSQLGDARRLPRSALLALARARGRVLSLVFHLETRASRARYRLASWHHGRPTPGLIPRGALGMHALIWVPTHAIHACLTRREHPGSRLDSGAFFDRFCRPGGWDKPTLPLSQVIDDSNIYTMLDQVARAWPERVPRGPPPAVTGPEGPRKLRKFERLLESIDRHGFRAAGPLKRANRCTYPDEIIVAIARDGAMLKALEGGNRRLIAARARGVPAVPVWVRGVHLEWAERVWRHHGGDPLVALIHELRTSVARQGLEAA